MTNSRIHRSTNRFDQRQVKCAPVRSELDENSEDERKKALAASQQQAAFVDVQSMDDEVERVISHRCAFEALRHGPARGYVILILKSKLRFVFRAITSDRLFSSRRSKSPSITVLGSNALASASHITDMPKW